MFAGFTIAASCARAAPGSPEGKQAFSKGNCQIQTPSLSQRSQSLIKPLLKNSFSTIFQGPGPGEASFHFSRFVCWVHYCSKLCQSSSWKPRREASLFQRQLPNSNSKPFQRSQSLIKPLLKNSFSTIFQGPGPGEAPFHFSRFVCWVHYCSKLCQSSPWKPRREASLFQRQLPNSNSEPSQRSQSLIKPLLKNSFSTIFQALGQERLHFTLVGLFAGFTIAASCARAAPGSPEEKQAFSKGNCQIQTPSLSQRSQSLIKPLLKNSFSTIFQALGQERLHFTLVGLFAGFTIAASCARAAPGSPEEKQAFSKGNCQIQTPSLSQRSQSLIKPLLKNSFSTIFQGPGPGEAPFHFSRFVCWVHYCSKLCQSSSWKPRREASLFQRQLPNSNSKPFPKEPIPY